MIAPARTWPPTARWACLIAASVALAVAFSSFRLSAAFLLGPMVAAIVLAASDAEVRVPRLAFWAAQAVVGCMIARAMRATIVHEIGQQWPLFTVAVVSVIAAACTLGYLLTCWRVLPGTTALWGSFPGAAAVMCLMAEAYGADVRLVAFMQYLRVVIVAVVASLVAAVFQVPVGETHAVAAPPVDWLALARTLALAGSGAAAGRWLRVPAGPLLVPMVLGAVAQNIGLLTIELPPPLLAAAYAVIGWIIGLRFTRTILVHVVRALPTVAAAIFVLIAGCALFAAALVTWAGIDPLTAYLAMSPGGADAVAIIAASSPRVDVPFVMSLQIMRFVVVLMVGPRLARFIADRAGGAHPELGREARRSSDVKTPP